MKILAIDTSGGSSGVALAVDGKVVAASEVPGARSHSTQLFSQIEDALKEGGINREELGGIAVTCGPGSFTGLRVGIATAKGIAAGLGVKVAGVSSLAALARSADDDQEVVAALLDARKGQVYAAAYEAATGETLLEEGAWEPEEFAKRLAGLGRTLSLIGSGIAPFESVFKNALRDGYSVADRERQDVSPVSVALLGAKAFERGEEVEAEFLTPVYHRQSEAEKNRKRGTKG